MAEHFDKDYIRLLAHKWKHGTLTEAERNDLARWEASHADEELELPAGSDSPEAIRARMYARVQHALHGGERRYKLIRWVPYVAAVILALTVGLFFWKPGLTDKEQRLMMADIPPGGNRAMLMLGDDQPIMLSEDKEGVIISNAGVAYTDGTGIAQVSDRQYATLVTPRGGQYRITLPDGTTVWLNAESVLRYPTAFTGNERKVELTGEAYFEVITDPRRPFVVTSGSQQLTVLGTTFNLNAYPDEAAITTTLVTGRVRLASEGTEETLAPGQQAIVQGNGIDLKRVDVQDYTAWKDGLIVLNQADLPSIIRQVERWYDVKFVLPPLPPTEKVFGELRRDVNLSELLHSLHIHYGLNFKIEGREVIVSN